MEPLAFPSVPPSPPEGGRAGAGAPALAVAPGVTTGAKAAEKPTLAALFASEESGLLRFALGLVGRRTVAEELVQETFLRLHQVWAQVENPRGWLYRSLRNLALNHLRDHARETEVDETTRPAEGDPPADALGQMEAVGLVKMLMAEMPEADRTLLRLKYVDDLKYGEISQRTGLGVGNVGYRLHHLLKGLASTLRQSGIEGSRR